MSSVREYSVVDPELGHRRAYQSSTVADMANVTAKTNNAWVADGGVAAPAPLRGWAPKSPGNPTGRWLIDADLADQAFARSSEPGASMADADLDAERNRIAEERNVLDLERRVFDESRLEQLENENARLRADNEKLTSQVSKLGGVIRDLTTDALA